MTDSIPIILLIAVLLGLICFAIFKRKKILGFFKNSNNEVIHDDHVIQKRIFTPLVVTLEESWRFIHEITESVVSRFSEEEQTLVLKYGKMLAKSGAVYNHVIEYGIRLHKSPKEKKAHSVDHPDDLSR